MFYDIIFDTSIIAADTFFYYLKLAFEANLNPAEGESEEDSLPSIHAPSILPSTFYTTAESGCASSFSLCYPLAHHAFRGYLYFTNP